MWFYHWICLVKKRGCDNLIVARGIILGKAKAVSRSNYFSNRTISGLLQTNQIMTYIQQNLKPLKIRDLVINKYNVSLQCNHSKVYFYLLS